MANMEYCMFENTYNDLDECYTKLTTHGIKYCIENANQYEKPYVMKLIELCQSINDEFSNISDEEE